MLVPKWQINLIQLNARVGRAAHPLMVLSHIHVLHVSRFTLALYFEPLLHQITHYYINY